MRNEADMKRGTTGVVRGADPFSGNVLDQKFERKLKTFAAELKTRAQGKTCGTCMSYSNYGCLSKLNFPEGSPLKIDSPMAVACHDHVLDE